MTAVPPEDETAVNPADDIPLLTVLEMTSGGAPEVNWNPRLDAVVATTVLKFMNALPAVAESTRRYVGRNPNVTVVKSVLSETAAENCCAI